MAWPGRGSESQLRVPGPANLKALDSDSNGGAAPAGMCPGPAKPPDFSESGTSDSESSQRRPRRGQRQAPRPLAGSH